MKKRRRKINWFHLGIVVMPLLIILLCPIFLLTHKEKELEEFIPRFNVENNSLSNYFNRAIQIDFDSINELILECEREKEANKSLGEFRLTAYCPCSRCCGAYADGITASGTIATPNHTIAVDPHIIPLGTRVNINGISYVAEDTGSAIKGNKIDIFVQNHYDCFDSAVNGVAEVFLEA